MKNDPDFTGHGITNNGRKALRQNGDGVGGSITYDYEGFGIGGAISSSKRTRDQNNTGLIGTGDRAETYTGGLKYDANNIYPAAQYTQTYNATRVGSPGLGEQSTELRSCCSVPVRLRSASVPGLPAV
ncbi:porin [Escherichia coli]